MIFLRNMGIGKEINTLEKSWSWIYFVCRGAGNCVHLSINMQIPKMDLSLCLGGVRVRCESE